MKVPVTEKQSDSRASSRGLLPGLTLACLVVAVISSLGAPLIPVIASAQHVSLAEAQWSLTITLLVASVAAPVLGRLGDGPYRRRVFLFALSALTLGGVLAALPLGFGPFLVGRGLQGLGVGLTPLAIATARDNLSPERMRAGVAMLSTTAAVGVGLGYPVTGLLAKAGGLHLPYWFGAAVAALALLIAWRVVPGSASRRRERLDILGAVLLGLGLAGLLLALSEGAEWGWGSGRVIGILGAAAAVLVVWAWWELRVAQPLVALRLLGKRAVLTANVATLLASVGMYLLISPVTTFVQTPRGTGYGLGGTVVIAGLVLIPFSATSYLITRVVPWLVRRTSYEVVLPLASAMMLAGMILFSLARDNIAEIVLTMAIAGVGTGSIFAVLPGYLMRAVPAHETSSAMSFNQILRYVGYATGSALSAVLLQAQTAPGQHFPANSGYTIIGMVAGLGWVLTAAAAILLPLRRSRTGPPPQG
ncbi:MFS transporter [Sciscionella marina]|uniref:MFS transporter n=1 Tax=Sciscionella marina TaxID=508770 RepID=UPI000685A086|nr:MFS transporter [Sciscionella marina]